MVVKQNLGRIFKMVNELIFGRKSVPKLIKSSSAIDVPVTCFATLLLQPCPQDFSAIGQADKTQRSQGAARSGGGRCSHACWALDFQTSTGPTPWQPLRVRISIKPSAFASAGSEKLSN